MSASPCIVCGKDRHHTQSLADLFGVSILTAEGEIVTGKPLRYVNDDKSAAQLVYDEVLAQNQDLVEHRCVLCDGIFQERALRRTCAKAVCLHCIRKLSNQEE